MVFINAERWRSAALGRLIAARLQERLAGGVSRAGRLGSFILFLAGYLFCVLAAAQPRWGFEWVDRPERGRDVLVAIDVSRSMLARDIQPNRLVRARIAAQDLIEQLEGDRVGLIAFAGTAFLQAPLTADHLAVRDSLQELDTEIIPLGGSNLSAAIEAAADALGKGEGDERALVIFSDGEELDEDALKKAKEHKDQVRIFTVGIGTVQGETIPIFNERGGSEIVRDPQGQPVITRLDDRRLRDIAEVTGGFYLPLAGGPAEMQHIAREGLGKMKEINRESQFSKQPVERYRWPLVAGVLCFTIGLLIGERRRAIKAAALLLSVIPASGDEGRALFAKGQYENALRHYEQELSKREMAELYFNAGNAAFALADYQRATEHFAKALGTAGKEIQADAAYNLANALARRGGAQKDDVAKKQDWKDAIAHYERVIERVPGHADATHNRDLLKRLLEEQEKKEQEKKEEQQNQQQQQEEQKQNPQQQQQGSEGKSPQQSSKGESEKPESQSSNEGKPDKAENQGESQSPHKTEQREDTPQQTKSPEPQQRGKPEPPPEQKPQQGELKAANEGAEEDREMQEAMDAAREGRMTEKDAKQLFEALRAFDRRVPLLDPRELERARRERPLKNW